jgi:hypothetical protein
MADWLNIAGGAGKGYVEGDQDNQRRAEFEALQRQRKRVEDQQKQDDALTAQLKNVRGAGTFTDYDTTPAPGGMGPPTLNSPTPKTTVRTAADVARERAAIYGGSGRLQDMQAAATQQQLAYQTEAADRTERNAKAQEILMQAGRKNAMGDTLGAARLLQQGYKDHVPDGHEMVIQMDENGVPHYSYAGPDGKFTQPLQPVTGKAVNDMIEQGTAMLSPELSMKNREINIQSRTAGAAETHAQAAMQVAKTAADKAYYDTKGRGGDDASAKSAAETAYYYAHAQYMRAKGAAEGGADTYGAPIAMQDANGNMVYGIPTKKGAGTPGITPISMPPGWTFPKPQPVMNDVQKGAHATLMKMDTEGAFDGPGGAAKRDKFIMTNDLGKFVKVDPIMEKLRNADPNKAAPLPVKGAPSPAKEATPEVTAEGKVSDAEKALSKFGARQKRDDPTGYSAALKQRNDARAELDALNAKYAATQPTGAAFTSARP